MPVEPAKDWIWLKLSTAVPKLAVPARLIVPLTAPSAAKVSRLVPAPPTIVSLAEEEPMKLSRLDQ